MMVVLEGRMFINGWVWGERAGVILGEGGGGGEGDIFDFSKVRSLKIVKARYRPFSV